MALRPRIHAYTHKPRCNASSTRAPALVLIAVRRRSSPPPLDSRLGEKSSQSTPHHHFHWMQRRQRQTMRTMRTKRRRERRVVWGSASHRSVYGRSVAWSFLPRARPYETHWSWRVCCSGGRGRCPRGLVSYHRPTGPVSACVECVDACVGACAVVYRQRPQAYIIVEAIERG